MAMLQAVRATSRRVSLARGFAGKPAYLQDGPPPGGYPSVVYKKSIPTKGPGNVALLGGLGAFLAYGWFFTLDSIWMRNRLKVEEYDVRMSLMPYLQAEEDQRYVEVRAVLDAKEAELMADVPGWQVNKPNFDTIEWVRPKALPY